MHYYLVWKDFSWVLQYWHNILWDIFFNLNMKFPWLHDECLCVKLFTYGYSVTMIYLFFIFVSLALHQYQILVFKDRNIYLWVTLIYKHLISWNGNMDLVISPYLMDELPIINKWWVCKLEKPKKKSENSPSLEYLT